MDVKATLETRVSQKSGKEYQCIVINLTDNYKKTVFLEQAELELLKVSNNSSKSDINDYDLFK